jgi:hypothetical protein
MILRKPRAFSCGIRPGYTRAPMMPKGSSVNVELHALGSLAESRFDKSGKRVGETRGTNVGRGARRSKMRIADHGVDGLSAKSDDKMREGKDPRREAERWPEKASKGLRRVEGCRKRSSERSCSSGRQN